MTTPLDDENCPLTLTISLTPNEAWHVAQFLKRSSYLDYADHSVDQKEAYEMMYACERLRSQLARQGIAPR